MAAATKRIAGTAPELLVDQGEAYAKRLRDAGEFLEHAQVFDNFYGTGRAQVEGAGVVDDLAVLERERVERAAERAERRPERAESSRRTGRTAGACRRSSARA